MEGRAEAARASEHLEGVGRMEVVTKAKAVGAREVVIQEGAMVARRVMVVVVMAQEAVVKAMVVVARVLAVEVTGMEVEATAVEKVAAATALAAEAKAMEAEAKVGATGQSTCHRRKRSTAATARNAAIYRDHTRQFESGCNRLPTALGLATPSP